ncbi:antiviral protein [Drechmeria coniospora]|uniref:Antiviral protein n=1 Tax=Drechmeria coniospora TaxID=98403 RepID=A0A151GCB3_DRECN|nr:antiviral protein [Drechmeria coniospora]KYK54747.1 antiviral protein [Drechmeria coniospora]
MSGSKAALKAINDGIRQQKFDQVVQLAQDFLQQESKNYQAHIFLAFALDKKNQFDEAEKVYRVATVLRPQDAQAFQGLVKLYEKQGSSKLAGYQQAVISLAQIFYDAEDMYKCQDVVDKFVDYARVHGDKLQLADALWIQLPESPLYPILEGRLPKPSTTYERIAHILEEFEKKRVNTLIGERRTRLGVTLSDVTVEAKREVYGQSKLEHIYRQLINWTGDDDLRRTYEEKLLQYCYERLLVSPPAAKAQEQMTVLKLASEMVAICHPYKLAWDITVEWQDHKEINDWDVDLLREYCSFFPDSDLYKVITGYLTSKHSPFPPAKEADKQASTASEASDSDDDDDGGGVPTSFVPLTDEDRLLMISEGISSTESAFAYRLVGHYLLQSGEYESTVEFMRKAKLFVANQQAKIGFSFQNSQDAYSLCLGTALVYYQSPRHHQEAKVLFDKVLEHDAASTPALIGVGLIFEEEEEYDEAIDFLSRALKRDESNLRVKSEAAWVKALKGDWQAARNELMQCVKLLEQKDATDKDLLADTQYRIGACIWNLQTSRQDRKQKKGESAYAYWLAALNSNLNHAPAYTSLGIFYNDYARDKKRARRCFQKALELSSAEVVAAERLARSFAEDGDWDRVELVAQRVVDSGKVKPPPGSKRKGISWPFAALGVAELNKQDFHKAIVSFQSALRLSPNDYHSWVGLGESYHSSGRYIAATKAILGAQALEADSKDDISGDTWFTKYMLANIKRELGEFDESIALYQSVLETHASEQGVILALMQTMVDSALVSVERGLYGKAAQLAADVIHFAATTTDSATAFNFWKSLADACSVFSSVQSRVGDFPAERIKKLLEDADQDAFEALASVDKVGTELVYSTGATVNGERCNMTMKRCVDATILCHKMAIHVSLADVHAQAVAYYNLGWAEFRAHACLPGQGRKTSSDYVKAAVRCFKRSIELESGNSEFWNALGVVTSEINPAVAQHAFVRSLHLNERSPVPWTNLGTLALLAGDATLANEAYTRAQSADPDYAHAWLGQGFVALLLGDAKEARGLFSHAMEIAEASSLATRRHYSSSIFDHVLGAPSNMTVASLIQPLFALNQERIGESSRAVQTLEGVCETIEADYEETESAESLARFTMAKTDLARAYLAAGWHDKAVECGEMALGLSSNASETELSAEQRRRARLSAHMTVGLGRFYRKEYKEAETCFRFGLEESDDNPDVTCLLARVLWAQGSEESREKARAALFEVIEKQPEHVQSVLLLGVISLLDEDEDSLEAVVEELEKLRTNDKVTAAEQSQIGEVLQAMAGLGEGRTKQDALGQVQEEVMLHPHLPHGWSSLARTTGDAAASQMALRVAARGMPPRGALESQEVACAYAGTGKAADAQRSALLAPWEQAGWHSLEVATASI